MELNGYFQTLYNLAESEEQRERIVFASLVTHLARGEMDGLLKNAPEGVCTEYARIWDRLCHIPIGVYFARPKFEQYEKTNRLIN